MNQITVTVDLTPRNLEIIRLLCEQEPDVKFAPVEAHPVENPFPEPQAEVVSQKETAPAVNTYTKADVKAVCLKFSKAGRQEELREAFAKFGAKKLTEISEADYPALMEALGDA